MVVYRHQNAGQNHVLLFANKFNENVAEFEYLGMTVTSQNCIQEAVKSRLNSRNARNVCLLVSV